MKNKFSIIILPLLIWLFVFTVPASAITDDEIQARCWTEKTCDDYKGIWGKSKVFRDAQAYGNGANDPWSVQNCRDVGDKPAARCFASPPTVPLQVGIPGVTTGVCSERNKDGEYVAGCTVGEKCGSAGICQPGIEGGFPGYLAKFYKFFVAALAVVAVVMVMWGGFKRIMAAGSPERVKDANSTITGAITGVVIALLSYSLLNLVNPQLVANTLPLIEKVKPDFFGFCPPYSGNESLYESGWSKRYGECFEGTRQDKLCNSDADCPGSSAGKGCIYESSTVYYENPSDQIGDTCGLKLNVNNRDCIALTCLSAGQGCFPEQGSDPIRYSCSRFFVQGKLTGIEVNYMDMVAVCNNGEPMPGHSRDGCYISKPNDPNLDNTIDVEGKAAYGIEDCYWVDGTPVRAQACSSSGLKGYALLLEVESAGSDDWYVVDAATCNSGTTKRVVSTQGTGSMDDPKAANVDRLDYEGVSTSKLFNPTFTSSAPFTIQNPIKCDLNITRQEFPDR